MTSKYSYVYINTNSGNTVFYISVTSNLVQRIHQHKNRLTKGFSSKYNLHKLVWYEVFEDINEAIKREKQLKGGSRQKKIELILKHNPSGNDLYSRII